MYKQYINISYVYIVCVAGRPQSHCSQSLSQYPPQCLSQELRRRCVWRNALCFGSSHPVNDGDGSAKGFGKGFVECCADGVTNNVYVYVICEKEQHKKTRIKNN